MDDRGKTEDPATPPRYLTLAPKDAKPDPARDRGEWVVERYLFGRKEVDRERGLTAVSDDGPWPGWPAEGGGFWAAESVAADCRLRPFGRDRR